MARANMRVTDYLFIRVSCLQHSVCEQYGTVVVTRLTSEHSQVRDCARHARELVPAQGRMQTIRASHLQHAVQLRCPVAALQPQQPEGLTGAAEQ